MIIWAHQLEVEIIPAKHQLRVKDTFTARANNQKGRNILVFRLNAQLKVTSLLFNQEKELVNLLKKSIPADEPHTLVYRLSREVLRPLLERVIPSGGNKDLIFELSYAGEIYEPLRDPRLYPFLELKDSRGIISKKGVFLSEETFWYPLDHNKLLSFFDLQVFIPEGYKVVSQGELLQQETKKKISYSRWQNKIAVRRLGLIAGDYKVRSLNVNGTDLYLYLFADDLQSAPDLLKKTSKVLHEYTRLIGKYPYKRFNLVENFSPSSHTIPGAAIVSPELIKAGKSAFPSGYLEHLIVHSWWGNYVFAERETGDWSEGLTQYYARIVRKELKGAEEARGERREILLDYSLSRAFRYEDPPQKFRGLREEFKENIPLAKTIMFFHLLREVAGEKIFFNTFSKIARRYGGKILSWSDLEKQFVRVTGKNISTLFSEWIKQKGAPYFTLKKARKQRVSKGYYIIGEIHQQGTVHSLKLPLRVYFENSFKDYNVLLFDKVTYFRLVAKKEPQKIMLDPEFHVFRTIPLERIPPSLNTTLLSRNKIAIIPEGKENYQRFAEILKGLYGIDYYTPNQLGRSMLKKNSLLILGNPEENPLMKDYAERLSKRLILSPEGFSLEGRRYRGERYNLIFSLPHPSREAVSVTLILHISDSPFKELNAFLQHKGNTYVVLKNNRVEKNGFFAEDEQEMNEVFYFQ